MSSVDGDDALKNHQPDDTWEWSVDRVVKIVDPDTFDLVLSRPHTHDLGFGMHMHSRDVAGPLRFRLLGIDAPEVSKEPEKAAAARVFVQDWLFAARSLLGLTSLRPLTAITHKPTDRPLPDGAFGRWLVDLRDSTGVPLADAMRAAGHYKGAP